LIGANYSNAVTVPMGPAVRLSQFGRLPTGGTGRAATGGLLLLVKGKWPKFATAANAREHTPAGKRVVGRALMRSVDTGLVVRNSLCHAFADAARGWPRCAMT